MWNFMTQPGLATATVDFTDDFALLSIGLLGVVVLAAGAIAFTAVRHYIAQRTKPTAEMASAAGDHRKAA